MNQETPEQKDSTIEQINELKNFNERIDGLDKAFDKKTQIALSALSELENEINDYCQNNDIKLAKNGEFFKDEMGTMQKELISIRQKINDLRGGNDFNIDEYEQVQISMPQAALDQGFSLRSNRTLIVKARDNEIIEFEFLPEEGFIIQAEWNEREKELTVKTSEGLEFVYMNKSDGIYQDQIIVYKTRR